MKHGDVTGAVSHTQHIGWIDVLSFNLGMENAVSIGTGRISGTGRALYTGYQLVRFADEATPMLMAMASNSQIAPQTAFNFLKSDSNTGMDAVVYAFEFHDVVIQKLDVEFEDGRYIERMQCLFKRIDVTHLPSGNGFGDEVPDH